MKKNDMPLFIAVLRNDAFLETNIHGERVHSKLQHIEIWAKNDLYSRSYSQICINLMTSFLKK